MCHGQRFLIRPPARYPDRGPKGGREVFVMRLRTVVLLLGLAAPTLGHAAGIPLLDATSAAHGSASVSLVKGTVKMKVTALAQLPAVQPLGATFDAYVYKAYLTSSTDAAVPGFLPHPFSQPQGRA